MLRSAGALRTRAFRSGGGDRAGGRSAVSPEVRMTKSACDFLMDHDRAWATLSQPSRKPVLKAPPPAVPRCCFFCHLQTHNLMSIPSDGHGSYTWPNGQKYTGVLKNSKPHGRGKMEWPCGNIYEGNYSNGKKEGLGFSGGRVVIFTTEVGKMT
jgi:hypothetical protein